MEASDVASVIIEIVFWFKLYAYNDGPMNNSEVPVKYLL